MRQCHVSTLAPLLLLLVLLSLLHGFVNRLRLLLLVSGDSFSDLLRQLLLLRVDGSLDQLVVSIIGDSLVKQRSDSGSTIVTLLLSLGKCLGNDVLDLGLGLLGCLF